MVTVALCFWEVRHPSTVRSKYSNCTVNPFKYSKEKQGIHFRHHRQTHLIHYLGRGKKPLLTHVIQFRIRVRPGYFRIQTRLTRTKRDLVDPDDPTQFQPWSGSNLSGTVYSAL